MSYDRSKKRRRKKQKGDLNLPSLQLRLAASQQKRENYHYEYVNHKDKHYKVEFQKNLDKVPITEPYKRLGYHGTNDQKPILQQVPDQGRSAAGQVKLDMPTTSSPHCDGFYTGSPEVAKGYAYHDDGRRMRPGKILEVFVPTGTPTVLSHHPMDGNEGAAVSIAANKAKRFGGSAEKDSKNAVIGRETSGEPALETRTSKPAAKELVFARSEHEVEIEYDRVKLKDPRAAEKRTEETNPDWNAKVAQPRSHSQKAASVGMNTVQTVAAAGAAVHATIHLMNTLNDPESDGLDKSAAVGNVAAAGAGTISSSAKALSSSVKGIRNLSAEAVAAEKMTSFADKAGGVAEKVGTAAVVLGVAAGTVASVATIKDAVKNPTAQNVTSAVVTTGSTATTGAALGLKVAGKITGQALGKTMGVVGAVGSVVSIYDSITNDTKSTASRVTSGITAGANIVGTAMLFTPLAPVGVGLMVVSGVTDIVCCFFW